MTPRSSTITVIAGSASSRTRPSPPAHAPGVAGSATAPVDVPRSGPRPPPMATRWSARARSPALRRALDLARGDPVPLHLSVQRGVVRAQQPRRVALVAERAAQRATDRLRLRPGHRRLDDLPEREEPDAHRGAALRLRIGQRRARGRGGGGRPSHGIGGGPPQRGGPRGGLSLVPLTRGRGGRNTPWKTVSAV